MHDGVAAQLGITRHHPLSQRKRVVDADEAPIRHEKVTPDA